MCQVHWIEKILLLFSCTFFFNGVTDTCSHGFLFKCPEIKEWECFCSPWKARGDTGLMNKEEHAYLQAIIWWRNHGAEHWLRLRGGGESPLV